ncbi:restriction endonuclease subunit S [Ideonella sp. 4Y11]|uniref:Restriction endonuclease subunit S n=1 Tax=Ideonella aquatica TaxID=2824119 RepID=A0A941BM47_9BURK|nr:restriction endonuclease subunit S [Ideonella aquatica]MBQ0961633.1 restriction endonuclease subunit S [Ideonella aquatica]
MICKINPRINRVWTVGPKTDKPQIASSEWIGFRSEAVQPAFANYYFKSLAFRDLLCSEVAGVGGSLTRAQPKRVAVYPVPVAPVAEQTRIADHLDTLMARIKACNDHLDAIPGLLRRFRQAVLDAATFGSLTEDWRNEQDSLPPTTELVHAMNADHMAAGGHERGNASEPTQEAHDLTSARLPGGWEISTLRDCCLPGRPITYGILKPGPELDEGVPYIRVADFPGNKLNLQSIKRTSPAIDLQFKRARLIGGDLLLSIRGSVGRLIVIPPSLEGANITQDTARLSINPRLNARFVYYALLSPDAQRRMANAVRGVAVRGINIGDVRALQIPLPSLTEQNEIVRRVDELFFLAEHIEARWYGSRARAQRLLPQVLQKAFRGDLLPQDANDEPASALLARLTTARNQANAEPKARKARAPRAARTLPSKSSSSTAMPTKSRQDEDVKGLPYLAGHLRRLGRPVDAKTLYEASELPVADFYKQLTWEIAEGHVKDLDPLMEPAHHEA